MCCLSAASTLLGSTAIASARDTYCSCSPACRQAMLSTAAVWLLLGLGLRPEPLPVAEGPITNPPGPTASCVLNPVSRPRREPTTLGPPPVLTAPAAELLPGQNWPGAGACLEAAVRAPAVGDIAPVLAPTPGARGAGRHNTGAVLVLACTAVGPAWAGCAAWLLLGPPPPLLLLGRVCWGGPKPNALYPHLLPMPATPPDAPRATTGPEDWGASGTPAAGWPTVAALPLTPPSAAGSRSQQ